MTDDSDQDPKTDTELIRLLKSSESSVQVLNDDCFDSEWTTEEVICLLKLIAEYEYLSQIESNNDQVYTKLSKLMTVSGHRKTNEEIKECWINLKEKWEDFKNGQIDNLQYSDQLHALFKEESQNDATILIIKGEELDGSVLNSTDVIVKENTSEEYLQKKRGCRRLNWTHQETECVVQVLEKYGMPNRNNLRKVCYVTVDYLKQHGYTRSEEQAQIKIKHLRALHNQVVRKTLKEEEFPFFKRIEVLMQQQILKFEKEHEESQNYIALDEHSKSDMEDANISIEYCETNEEEDDPYFKKTRQIWTDGEIRCLLKFIEQNGIIAGKQLRKVVNKVVDYLAEHGFYRTPAQILIRWKNTKALYWAAYRKKLKQPERECPFFYRLHAILNPDDATYDGKQAEDEFEEEVFQEISAVNNTEQNSDITNFNFNDVVTNYKEDSFISLKNSSNSNDNFSSVQGNSNSRPDPLENEQNQDEAISNQKRKRSDSSDLPVTISSLDSIDHYCISLAHSIKKLNDRKQAKLKIEIQQLMYKAEFDPNF